MPETDVAETVVRHEDLDELTIEELEDFEGGLRASTIGTIGCPTSTLSSLRS